MTLSSDYSASRAKRSAAHAPSPAARLIAYAVFTAAFGFTCAMVLGIFP